MSYVDSKARQFVVMGCDICDIHFSIVIGGEKSISEGPLSFSELKCRPELKMDPWVILPMERERHSQQFLSCQPTDGFITGTQVEMLFFS